MQQSETPQTEREGEREADTDGVPTTLQGPPLRHRSGIYLDCTMNESTMMHAFVCLFLNVEDDADDVLLLESECFVFVFFGWSS